MKACPKCNGRGTVGYYHIDHFVDIECDRCNGSGEVSEVPTTNEEWLRSATTEELEEEILAWWVDGADTYSHFGLFKHEIDGAKEKIVKWLKEKHE